MLSHICRYYYKYLYGFEASLKEIAVFEICKQYDGKLFPLIFHLFIIISLTLLIKLPEKKISLTASLYFPTTKHKDSCLKREKNKNAFYFS